MLNVFKVKSKLFTVSSMGAWHFIAVPKAESKKIRETFGDMKVGFGSIRVIATIGRTKWKTSIFPDSKSGTYFLPVKSAVRKKEHIKLGDDVGFSVEILV